MRSCVQTPMMRSQKTNPTASLAHQKKHPTTHQSKFDEELVKRKD